MLGVIQRVKSASVSVEGEKIAQIGQGFLLLVGVTKTDGEDDARYIAEKTAHLRVFEDENGKMNRSLDEVKGSVLAVSQFTLCGDARKGHRPSFSSAAPGEEAKPLYETVCRLIREEGVPVACGRFGADMQVELVNDGPVTILFDSDTWKNAKF